jgi:type II secretory pathway component PulF
MTAFSYRGKEQHGRLAVGEVQAPTRSSAISLLRRKGYFLLQVEPENQWLASWREKFGIAGLRLSLRQRTWFTQQLATLLGAGMHLKPALKTLARQAENRKWGQIVEQLHRDIEGSSSLSTAMARHPRAFPTVYSAIIHSAEETGTLAETLNNLSRQLKAQVGVSGRIRSAMIYPLFLLAVGGVVVGILVSFVIPRFVALFVNAEQRLPLPTQILVGSIQVMKQWGWFLLLAAAIAGILIGLAARQERVRITLDNLILRLPLIGALKCKLHLARFARTLGSLLGGGVKIITALEIVEKTTENRAFAREIVALVRGITRGVSLAEAMKKQRYFSELMTNMVGVGEKTGALGPMLMEVADIYDQESETLINTITNLLGPVMIIGMGLVIGFVVLAILLPIFETSTMIG